MRRLSKRIRRSVLGESPSRDPHKPSSLQSTSNDATTVPRNSPTSNRLSSTPLQLVDASKTTAQELPKVRFQDLEHNQLASPTEKLPRRRFKSLSWKRKSPKVKKSSSSLDLFESTDFEFSVLPPSTPSDSNTDSSSPVSKHQIENDMLSFGGPGHSFTASTAGFVPSTDGKQLNGPTKAHFSSQMHNQSPRKFRFFFGRLHVVNGVKLTLAFYIVLNIFGLIFGETATKVWGIIPLIVIPSTVHAFTHRCAKFIIPLLLITLVQSLVCVLMAMIVAGFSFMNFEKIRVLTLSPSTTVTVVSSVALIFICVLLAFIFLWQATIILSCIQHYEYLRALEKTQSAANAKAPSFLVKRHNFMPSSELQIRKSDSKSNNFKSRHTRSCCNEKTIGSDAHPKHNNQLIVISSNSHEPQGTMSTLMTAEHLANSDTSESTYPPMQNQLTRKTELKSEIPVNRYETGDQML